jgi:glutamate N-acetyltransferase/amino-acid N-acetyltransferase
MAVGLTETEHLAPVPGVELAVASAGIKYKDRRDLLLLSIAPGSTCAAVFTRNAFCAAPVVLARQHLNQSVPRYLLVNAGNANAGTGEQGLAAARSCCQAVAIAADCDAAEVLPFSTGVIGEPLPVDKIRHAVPDLLAGLHANGWVEAARAIMTTDTVAKGVTQQLDLDGQMVTVTGIAKGSGMIRPDMATMLAYIATDAAVDGDTLNYLLHDAMAQSFNRITVDGDTSTNDACVLIATGAGSVKISGREHEYYQALAESVTAVCAQLAQAIVRDGEGATRFITVAVNGGATAEECRQVAYTIAHSPLVKTAFFAGDPNWGRILAAVGRAGLVDLQLDKVQIYLDQVCLVRDGGRAADYTEEKGRDVMARDDITIRVELNRGSAADQVWTCDFSYDYVKINAEYRT